MEQFQRLDARFLVCRSAELTSVIRVGDFSRKSSGADTDGRLLICEQRIGDWPAFLDSRRWLIDHLVPISIRCHNILIIGVRIHLSDECSVEFFSRPGIKAGASSQSQQANSQDHQE
jgi:hypothetical protein